MAQHVLQEHVRMLPIICVYINWIFFFLHINSRLVSEGKLDGPLSVDVMHRQESLPNRIE